MVKPRSFKSAQERAKRRLQRDGVLSDADRRRWNGCWRKRWFGSHDAAQRFADEVGQRPYRCRECKGWHLTSKERRKT